MESKSMEVGSTPGRTVMPILGKPTLLSEIPFAMLVPHARQADRNHGQTLNRLAERGGLGVTEAIAILEDRAWRNMPESFPYENEHRLINMVREWRSKALGQSGGTK